jgi:hypothetical protein
MSHRRTLALSEIVPKTSVLIRILASYRVPLRAFQLLFRDSNQLFNASLTELGSNIG